MVSDPSAVISIDGHPVGTGMWTGQLPSGTHGVHITAPLEPEIAMWRVAWPGSKSAMPRLPRVMRTAAIFVSSRIRRPARVQEEAYHQGLRTALRALSVGLTTAALLAEAAPAASPTTYRDHAYSSATLPYRIDVNL